MARTANIPGRRGVTSATSARLPGLAGRGAAEKAPSSCLPLTWPLQGPRADCPPPSVAPSAGAVSQTTF